MKRSLLCVCLAFIASGCDREPEFKGGASAPAESDLPTSASPGAPVAAGFNPADGFGLTRIEVDGQNLLVGNGFHIIGGQQPNHDVEPNQINSESPSTSEGTMFLGGDANGAAVPFGFRFDRPADDPGRLDFELSVGPLPTAFASVSIPLEARLQLFEYWRSSAEPETLRRFDGIPIDPNYGGGVGSYAIAGAPAGATWGEIIGPEYSIRVEITQSSRAMHLYFVNAPSLATGVRDVEFSFGTVAANETVTARGRIRVFRTDPSRLPKRP